MHAEATLSGQRPLFSVPSSAACWDTFPARLYCKGKRLFWDPEDIDFSQDQADWKALNATQRRMMVQMLAIFAEGEGAVTTHLTPMLMRLSRAGSREDEIYLTQFLSEEARHVEAFDRFRAAVCPDADVVQHQTPSSRLLFDVELPRTMARLLTDDSLHALAEAAATYNMIMEGVVAETGYFTWRAMLVDKGIFPGMLKIVLHVSMDEARHIAYGLHLLGRLIHEDASLLAVVRKRMKMLLGHALRMQQEIFMNFPPGNNFGLTPLLSIDFALRQFNYRIHALERAAAHGPEEYELRQSTVETYNRQATETLIPLRV